MSDVYSEVHEALQATVATNRCLASSEAQIQRALVHFRTAANEPETTRQLERMSITLHKLWLARAPSKQAERIAALEQLRTSAECWKLRLPIH